MESVVELEPEGSINTERACIASLVAILASLDGRVSYIVSGRYNEVSF